MRDFAGEKGADVAAVSVEQAEMRQGVPESTSVLVQAWGRFVLRHAGLPGSCIAKDFIAGGLDEHSLRWVHSSMRAEGLFFVQVLGRWGSATIEKYVADAVAEKASWAPLAAGAQGGTATTQTHMHMHMHMHMRMHMHMHILFPRKLIRMISALFGID